MYFFVFIGDFLKLLDFIDLSGLVCYLEIREASVLGQVKGFTNWIDTNYCILRMEFFSH